MPESCLLYYITDRRAFPGNDASRIRRLLEKIGEAALCGVDYIQLREKDLTTRELERVAGEALGAIREAGEPAGAEGLPATRLLINSRTDVALSVGAHGVHLRSEDVSPMDVRTIWNASAGFSGPAGTSVSPPFVSVSCHSADEVRDSASNKANVAVFGPVFEKKSALGVPVTGLAALRQACRASIPVIALGGITVQNAGSCLQAGAAGIAGIRLFQDNDIAQVVSKIRS